MRRSHVVGCRYYLVYQHGKGLISLSSSPFCTRPFSSSRTHRYRKGPLVHRGAWAEVRRRTTRLALVVVSPQKEHLLVCQAAHQAAPHPSRIGTSCPFLRCAIRVANDATAQEPDELGGMDAAGAAWLVCWLAPANIAVINGAFFSFRGAIVKVLQGGHDHPVRGHTRTSGVWLCHAPTPTHSLAHYAMRVALGSHKHPAACPEGEIATPNKSRNEKQSGLILLDEHVFRDSTAYQPECPAGKPALTPIHIHLLNYRSIRCL